MAKKNFYISAASESQSFYEDNNQNNKQDDNQNNKQDDKQKDPQDQNKNKTSNVESKSNGKGFLYPTPPNPKLSNKFLFGPKDKNSTQMAVFFRENSHVYPLSPANYNKIKRLIDQAKDVGQDKLNIALTSGEIISATPQTQFLWRYAKVALVNKSEDKPALSIQNIKSYSRVLLCKYVSQAVTVKNTELIESYGLYVPLDLFYDAGSYLYVENTIDTNSEIDDF